MKKIFLFLLLIISTNINILQAQDIISDVNQDINTNFNNQDTTNKEEIKEVTPNNDVINKLAEDNNTNINGTSTSINNETINTKSENNNYEEPNQEQKGNNIIPDDNTITPAEIKVNIVPYQTTYSDPYDDIKTLGNNHHSEGKKEAGLSRLEFSARSNVLTYNNDNTYIEDGMIIKSNPTVFITLGGINTIVPFYKSPDDLIKQINQIPISGAAYDGWYLDTITYDNQVIAKVIIGGLEGYVLLQHIQIIPTPLIQARSYYQKEGNNWTFYEANDPLTSKNYTKYVTSDVPSFAKDNEKYVSNTSNYYQNLMTGQTYESYNYFQMLPARATSEYTASDYQRYLASLNYYDSVYYNATQGFIDGQNYPGVNSLLLFGIANNESGYGRSYYARHCYNFYGRYAFDSDPDDACRAVSYSNPSSGASAEAFFLNNEYLDPLFTYNGSHPGDKSSGINAKYASDPNWGFKVASCMKNADAFLGSKEYNRYSIGITNFAPTFKNPTLTQRQNVMGLSGQSVDYNICATTRGPVSILLTADYGGVYRFQPDSAKYFGPTTSIGLTNAKSGSYPNYEGVKYYVPNIFNDTICYAKPYQGEYLKSQCYVSANDVRILNHNNFLSPGKDQVEQSPLEGMVVSGAIIYNAHSGNIKNNWTNPGKNGDVIGDPQNNAPALNGIAIGLQTGYGGINYTTHVAYSGWQNLSNERLASGDKKCSNNIEALQINLTNKMAHDYDIYYRTYVPSMGWMDWAKNGQLSGTFGQGKYISAYQIKLVIKNDHISDYIGNRPYLGDKMLYQTQAQDIGWSKITDINYQTINPNVNKQIEAMRFYVPDPSKDNIKIQSQVENVGWQDPVYNGEITGTEGQGLRLETFKAQLEGDIAQNQTLYYHSNVNTFNWAGYTNDFNPSGSIGIARPINGVEFQLINKNDKFHENQLLPIVSDTLCANGQVENKGWLTNFNTSQPIGTTGEGLRLETISINSKIPNVSFQYQAQVQYKGWMDWVNDNQMAGTVGEGLRLEALKIKLCGSDAYKYDVKYRAHVQNKGWQNWVYNGDLAGSVGEGLELECIEINIVPKNN